MAVLGRDQGRLRSSRLRDLGRARRDLDLVDAEEVVRALVLGEEDAGGVEVKVKVAHHGRAVGGLVERSVLLLAAQVGEDDDFVRETGARRDHVVLGVEAGHAAATPAERAARVADLSVDAEDLVEVEDRVREHGGAIRLHERNGLRLLRGVLAGERDARLVRLRNERLHGGVVLRPVVLRVRLQVGHRAARGLGLEQSQLLLRPSHGGGVRRGRKRCCGDQATDDSNKMTFHDASID